jgi:hypothetical protein
MNFFFKLLSLVTTLYSNLFPENFITLKKETKKQFDFDILNEVFKHLISNGLNDNSLSALNRISR